MFYLSYMLSLSDATSAEAALDGDIGFFSGNSVQQPLSLPSGRSVSLSTLGRASWLGSLKEVLKVLRYSLRDLVPLHWAGRGVRGGHHHAINRSHLGAS